VGHLQLHVVAFEPHPIQALSFTGPSAEVLTRVLFASDKPPTFDLGLMPGVFIGSFLAAALFRELKLEGFEGGASMRRYIIGAMCMGFGGMLAGGCAVGAGLSGAAVFTITSWVTLCAIWAAAALTDRLVDQRPRCDDLDQAMPGSRVARCLKPLLRRPMTPLFRTCHDLADAAVPVRRRPAEPASLLARRTWAAKATKIVEESCSVCHGSRRRKRQPGLPAAGRPARRLYRAAIARLQVRQAQEPRHERHHRRRLRRADFKALGAYFQSRATHTHEIEDAELALGGPLPLHTRQPVLRRAGLQCLPW
jgi:mono/diheme cytochrome c family protein